MSSLLLLLILLLLHCIECNMINMVTLLYICGRYGIDVVHMVCMWYIWYDIYIYIYIYLYLNLQRNAVAKLFHPWSRDSQGQETFLAPSADKQIRNYDTECSIFICIYIIGQK